MHLNAGSDDFFAQAVGFGVIWMHGVFLEQKAGVEQKVTKVAKERKSVAGEGIFRFVG